MSRIDALSAPLFVSWQLTKDCNLACLHCCTDSAPGRALPDELSGEQALRVAADIASAGVPYVMLCGGEPTLVPHFFETAEVLGRAGVQLKVETNGQAFGPEQAERLAGLPIRSVQISLDGATQAVYGKQRPGGSLEKALSACRAVRGAGLPLEVTFAPTKVNIHEAEATLALAAGLGAFRFNTGMLMRLGTAAKLWERLEPSSEEYASFRALLERKEAELAGTIELCWRPFSIEEALAEQLGEPPATLLVLPNGKVKVSAPLPWLCADLKRHSVSEVWDAYRKAWRHPLVRLDSTNVLKAPERLAESSRWTDLPNEAVLS